MLKGHSLKLKKALDLARKGEALPSKRPRSEEVKSPKPVKAAASPVKSPTGLAKDVERLMAKLADIEQTREDIGRATELVLEIDLERFRRALDQVEFVQKTIRAMEQGDAMLVEEVGGKEV